MLQAQAYREVFKDFEDATISLGTAKEDISEAAKKHKENLILIAQAPFSNISAAFPDLKEIDRIVMMGGWFEEANGDIQRLGYNTAVDMEASKTVLEQDEVPVLIIGSELVKKSKFTLREKERAVFGLSQHKTKLGEALFKDMDLYWANKIPAKTDLNIADMVAAHIAAHPEEIKTTVPVKVKFAPIRPEVDMFHPDSKHSIKVDRVENSNIHIISELDNPELLRCKLVDSLVSEFYPDVTEIEFRKLIESDLAAEEIAKHLNDPRAAL